MKGKYTLQILKAIGDVAVRATDVLEVIAENPDKTGLTTKPKKNLNVFRDKKRKTQAVHEKHLLQVRRYHNLMAWLKRDNLIKEVIIGHKRFFQITAKGKTYRTTLKKRQAQELPSPHYQKRKAKRTLIVAFDVPEKENRKRAWLREALKNIGFKMAQKSVWIGRMLIPPELLQDLRRMHLLEFIEIFAVTQKGTLRKLKH